MRECGCEWAASDKNRKKGGSGSGVMGAKSDCGLCPKGSWGVREE